MHYRPLVHRDDGFRSRRAVAQSSEGTLTDKFKLASVSRRKPESTPDKAAANLLSTRDFSLEGQSSEPFAQFRE